MFLNRLNIGNGLNHFDPHRPGLCQGPTWQPPPPPLFPCWVHHLPATTDHGPLPAGAPPVGRGRTPPTSSPTAWHPSRHSLPSQPAGSPLQIPTPSCRYKRAAPSPPHPLFLPPPPHFLLHRQREHTPPLSLPLPVVWRKHRCTIITAINGEHHRVPPFSRLGPHLTPHPCVVVVAPPGSPTAVTRCPPSGVATAATSPTSSYSGELLPLPPCPAHHLNHSLSQAADLGAASPPASPCHRGRPTWSPAVSTSSACRGHRPHGPFPVVG
jgi:hypothetical protein